MINLISSICVWAAAAAILLRVAERSGMTVSLGAITADKSLKGGFSAAAKEVFAVFGIALLFRVIVFALSIFAIYMAQDLRLSWHDLMGQYLKWDANNYQRIATGGYSYHTENGDYTTLAFFPLYPWLVRFATAILRDQTASGIVVSGLLYAGACGYLYKLLSLDYSKATAIRAIVYISVFPHALFFGVMMNESTLLFTMCATLYYIRTHNWKLAGISGALAALSRLVGILLAIPAAVEWLAGSARFGGCFIQRGCGYSSCCSERGYSCCAITKRRANGSNSSNTTKNTGHRQAAISARAYRRYLITPSQVTATRNLRYGCRSLGL